MKAKPLKKDDQPVKRRVLDRKKTDPDKFVYTGHLAARKPEIQLFKYNAKECVETRDLQPEDIGIFEKTDYTYWLNIHGLNDPDSISLICKKLKIHSLVIQDILDVNQRPKYQEFENFSFFTTKSIVPSVSVLTTEQMSFVFGNNYLVSFQERKADYFEHLRFSLREKTGIIRERGTDYLLFALLESILDNYFKSLQQLEKEMDNLNAAKINAAPTIDVIERIEGYKKHIHFIRKTIQPIKDFTLTIEREKSPFIEKRHLKYFFEIKDLCLTLLDSCDFITTSLDSSTNLFFSVQNQRMNLVMKTLTIVATIFIPLTFIAGVYGMNFRHMPELDWKYGYPAVWALMVLIFCGMVLYLRKRKWF